jgi:hypothetical protein
MFLVKIKTSREKMRETDFIINMNWWWQASIQGFVRR